MKFDCVIVGGGLVGLSLAFALKDVPIRIALIEREGTEKPLESSTSKSFALSDRLLNARAIALSESSQRFYEAINLWPFLSSSVEAIKTVEVSEKGAFGVTRLNAVDENLKALGYVVSATALTDTLNKCLKESKNCTFFRPDAVLKLDEMEREGGCEKELEKEWEIVLQSGAKISTDFIVGSDGTHSLIRTHQGIGLKTHDYNQVALLTNIVLSPLSKNQAYTAYERFTPTGPIALLPFSKNIMKLVWVTSKEKANELMTLEKTLFLNACQDYFGRGAGRFTGCGERFQYPLFKSTAEALYGERSVLIGNAANTLHPVGAQGLNLGLRDVATLVELIVSSVQKTQTLRSKTVNSKPLGSKKMLQAYSQLRQADHTHTRYLTDLLATKETGYALGILGCEWIKPFKRFVISRGMGRKPNLPRLSRGVVNIVK